jgi:hypothetical protein
MCLKVVCVQVYLLKSHKFSYFLLKHWTTDGDNDDNDKVDGHGNDNDACTRPFSAPSTFP